MIDIRLVECSMIVIYFNEVYRKPYLGIIVLEWPEMGFHCATSRQCSSSLIVARTHHEVFTLGGRSIYIGTCSLVLRGSSSLVILSEPKKHEKQHVDPKSTAIAATAAINNKYFIIFC